MPYASPNPSAQSAGDTDAVYVRRLREGMEDNPLFSPEQFQATGTTSEIRCSDFPIYDGDQYNDSSQRFVITVGGTVQTLIDNRANLTAVNQVVVDYEQGWLYWHPNFPPNGLVVIRKSKVRYRDERMLEALYGGLRAMTPYCWQAQVDTSVTLQTLVWEYNLPPIFWDPRVRILDVEVLEIPSTVNRYGRLAWRKSPGALNLLQIPKSQTFTPGSNLRISFAGPYKSLADVPEHESQLPLLWAKGYLLSNKEILRVRQDTANVTQDQNANPVGASQNAGSFFFAEFLREAQAMARPLPVPPVLPTYAR